MEQYDKNFKVRQLMGAMGNSGKESEQSGGVVDRVRRASVQLARALNISGGGNS
jgi:hypothetical protein